MTTKKTELGEIPEDWEVVELGDEKFFEIVGGSTPSRKEASFWEGGTIPWATPSDLTSLEGNEIKETSEEITSSGLDNCSANLLPINSVLMTSRATLGEVAINEVPMATNQGFASFVCTERVDPHYLLYSLKTKKPTLYRFAGRSTFKEISKRSLRLVKIAIPPLPEQRKIAVILSSVDETIQKTDNVIEKTQRLKKGLMQELLTKGVPIFSIYQNQISDALISAGQHINTGERNLCSHLRTKFEHIFSGEYDVDVELQKDTSERPDIVVHRRSTNQMNGLAFEVKIRATPSEANADIAKLSRLMLGSYEYRSGVFVDYDSRLCLDELANLDVNVVLVRPDGTLDCHLVPDKRKFKQTELGEIPEDWEVGPLKTVATKFVSGGTPDTENTEYWGGDIPWMTGVNVESRVVSSGMKYISKSGLDNSATNLVPKDSLLVVTRTDVGKVARTDLDIAISQDLTGVILKEDLAHPEFVSWYLFANPQRIERYKQGSTIQGLLREDLQNFLLPLPPLPEQRKIAAILSSVDETIQAERAYKEKLQRLKKGLMQVLLTGKVRVKTEAA